MIEVICSGFGGQGVLVAGMILAVPVGLIFIKFYEYGAFDSLINSVKELAREIEEIRHGDGKEP